MRAPDVRTPGGNRANAEDESTQNVAIVAAGDAERKEQATLAARLAFKGYSLHELAGGGFLISRWDRTAHCSDLGAVAGFLRRIEGEA